jgi:hypothetical protein
MIRLHLVGAKAAKQMAAHAALAHAAKKEGKDPPKAPVLNFDNFSGRGVQLRVLDPDQKDKIAEIVAKNLGEGGLITEYHRLRERGCVYRCIVAVTREKELDEAGLAKATWAKVTEEELEEKGPLSARSLFTTKDITTLTAWYREQHEVSTEDIAAIMGKAVELAE